MGRLRFSTPIIDAHVSLGRENHLHLDADELSAQMRACRVTMSIARPMGGELVVHNRAGNDRILACAASAKALVTANPWYGQDAIAELKRCHAGGAVGVYLHPARQGFFPTDEIVTPLIEFARESDWPVVVHTGTYIHSDVLAVAELARRHPDMTFVCDGAGFADMWFELPGVLTETSNVILCMSLIWTRAMKVAIDTAGEHRILFGSGSPRDSLEAALRRVERLELSELQQRAILHDNATRIFRLNANH